MCAHAGRGDSGVHRDHLRADPRTIRGIRSEVEVGTAEGLPASSVISCDNLITIPLATLDDRPVGHLDLQARAGLDRALRYALDISY